MRIINNANASNIFDLINKTKATKKEIFDIKSKNGINVAGKTNKLDKIYTILL